MLHKKLSTIVIAFLMFSLGTNAQQMLSLEECRKLAIENNNALKIASAQERVAYYQKREALMQYFPKISATGTYLHLSEKMHLIGQSQIPSQLSVPIPPPLNGIIGDGLSLPVPEGLREKIYKAGEIDLTDVWLAGVSLTQPIFTGGRIVALNDIRKYAQELAKNETENQTTNVIVEVDEAYWQVVSLVNKMKLAQAYVDLLTKMDKDVEAMVEEGVATKSDRLSVSVKLNEGEMALTKATNGLSLAKMLLCQLCGIEISDRISLADEDIETIISGDQNDIILPDMNEALLNRHEIKSLDLATKIYKRKERIAVAEFLPTAGVSVGYLWTKPNLQDGVQDKFNGMFNVGVKVSLPLNFISSSAKVKAAKAETRIQEFKMEDAKEKIMLQINQTAYKVNEANKRLTSAKRNKEKAEENLRYANVGFDEGVIATSDVLAAHTAWISAQADMIDAQIDIKLCNIYFNKAVGRKF